MIRLLTYPMNVVLILSIGFLMSLINLSYIYSNPSETNIIYAFLILIMYIACSFLIPKAKRIESSTQRECEGLYKVFLFISIFGFAIEFFIYGVPAVSSKGRDGFGGIPVLHVIFYSSTMISVLFATLYSDVKKIILTLSVATAISVALLSRQMLMICFTITLISIMLRYRITTYQYFKIIVSIIVVIIAFGILGNIRQQLSGDYFEGYIIEVGGANDSGAAIGDILYWLWLYLASPVYNLFLNFDSYNAYGESCNMQVAYGSCSGSYMMDVLLPSTVSKYLGSQEFIIDMARPYLNAGTAFSASARIGGILAVSLQIILQLLFYFVGLILTPVRVRHAFIVYFSALSLFMVFDNLFIRGEFFFGFLLIMFAGLKIKIKRKSPVTEGA